MCVCGHGSAVHPDRRDPAVRALVTRHVPKQSTPAAARRPLCYTDLVDAPTIIAAAVTTALQAVGLYILQDLRTRIVRLEDLYLRDGRNAPAPSENPHRRKTDP